MNDPFLGKLQEVRLRAQRAVEIGLAKERSPQKMGSALVKTQALLDVDIKDIHRLLEERQLQGLGKTVDCRAGCSHCCFRQVAASVAEIAAIWAAVQAWPAEQQQALREKLSGAIESDACAFLENDLCSVYRERPISCRGLNSVDVNVCIRISETLQAPEERPSVPAQDALAEAALTGNRIGLFFEAIEPGLLDLAASMKLLLDGNGSLEDVLNGGSTFNKARIADPRDALADIQFLSTVRPVVASEGLTGVPPPDELARIKPFEERFFQQGDYASTFSMLGRASATELLRAVDVPRVYATAEEIDQWRAHFERALEEFASAPFPSEERFNALSTHYTMNLTYQGRNDAEILRRHGQVMCEVTKSVLPDLVEPIERHKREGRIRLGYISSNMKAHNGCRWAQGWVDNHGEDIETFAINLGLTEDEVTERFKSSADHYFRLARSVPENARFVKSLGLDVLIFTDIGMSQRAYPYATMRMAPVQCTAWGHPDTSGLPQIDFYLSSHLMEPEDASEHYTEQLVRLPGSGLCYPRISTPIPEHLDRKHFGLPETGPLLFMAQTIRKVLPQFDWVFAEITRRMDAPLVMLEGYRGDTAVTKERLEKAGVKTHWLPFLPRGEFLRLMQLCDVSLDPFLWSGGNTSIEALASGKPVVTLPGPLMRGRHTLAFLKLAGAEGLVARDAEDYIAMACDFERQRDAMKDSNAEALFEDKVCVVALDKFIRGQV